MHDGHTNKDSTTVMERHSDDESEMLQVGGQVEARRPSTLAVNEVANDYRDLTDLMKDFEVEIGSFTGHMKHISNDVSNFAGLTALWDEQAKTIDQEIKEYQMDTDSQKVLSDKKK